jgi:hypothetical protein
VISIFYLKSKYNGAYLDRGDDGGEGHIKYMFGKGKEWDCYKNLVDQYTQTGDVMDAIFAEFDDDRSGFIDSKELKMLGFALGFPMDDAEVDMCVKDLDTNRDGKISLDEFREWWLSGRQGLSQGMKMLTGAKVRAMAKGGKFGSVLEKALAGLSKVNPADFKTNTLKLSMNMRGTARTQLTGRFLFPSPYLFTMKDQFNGRHYGRENFDTNLHHTESMALEFIIHVKKNVKEAQERAQNLVQAMKEDGMPFDVHVCSDGNKICIGLIVHEEKFPFKPVRELLQAAREIFGENWIDMMKNSIKGNQYIDFNLRLGTSAGAVLKKGGGSLF